MITAALMGLSPGADINLPKINIELLFFKKYKMS
jgi:hypothetical protein